MAITRTRLAALAVIFSIAALAGPRAKAQNGTYSSQSVQVGAGGYILNFGVIWTCDDYPNRTVSSPGVIDLVGPGGNLAGELVATAKVTGPYVTVSGAGSVSSLNDSVNEYGADGTPADAHLHGVWTITGLSPGAYTLRFWFTNASVPRINLSTIDTDTLNTGGGGTVGSGPTPTPTPTPTPSPTPTPTPTPSPTPSPPPSPTPSPTPTRVPTPTPTPTPTSPPVAGLSVPTTSTVYQVTGISASAHAGSFALVSVAIDFAPSGTGSWTRIFTDAHPSTPADTEALSYPFTSTGTMTVRATVTESSGQSVQTTQPLTIAKAAQGAVSLAPAAVTVTQGQGVAFSASGGETGNYSWGGAASGEGASDTLTFPNLGSFTVSVVDAGNADYLPSAAAVATVTVQAPFNTLTLAASGGGSVSGGGSYPANAQATAVATADPGNAFSGWTGDEDAASPSLLVLMDANKSLVAHFTALLAQWITFIPPGTVTTRTPPLSLSVSATSGLPVSLVLTSGPATLAGNVVTPTGGQGEVTLTASQGGNGQFLAAQPVVISFPIGPPSPGVLFSDDSSASKKSDKDTKTTSYTSARAH